MPAWKLILAYDGTSFHGWQVQPGLPTVQGALAQALHHLSGESVLPQGSGRTDTGVHALAQVASFTLHAPIPPANLLRALNRALPPAIRILKAEHAPENFHARHHALRKTYEYRLFPLHPPDAFSLSSRNAAEGSAVAPATNSISAQICPPFLAPYVYACPHPLSLDSLIETAPHILGTHDFTSFAASDPDIAQRTQPAEKSNIRTIEASRWRAEPPLLIYTVTGSGFLHHMVRNLVGTFLDSARGLRSARGLACPSVLETLAARNRAAAGPTAPARGLFLHSVEYPA